MTKRAQERKASSEIYPIHKCLSATFYTTDIGYTTSRRGYSKPRTLFSRTSAVLPRYLAFVSFHPRLDTQGTVQQGQEHRGPVPRSDDNDRYHDTVLALA